MAIGKKYGGRTKGTPNKRTKDVQDKLEALGVDPISAMARLAQQAEAEGDKLLAARMYTELAPYVCPKRKAIEVTNTDDWEGFNYEAVKAQKREMLKQVVAEYERLPAAEKKDYFEAEH